MSAPAQRCQVMGIVNVTDDSFSDGGKFNTVDTALTHAHTLIDQGADIIDIGGESTRPGATRVSESQELARVVPVVRELAAAGILVSVDTMRASVAAAALEAGAGLINDVSGGQADPEMLRVCAAAGVPVCLMHWDTQRFGSASGRAQVPAAGIRAAVRQRLQELIDEALAAGITQDNIILDPGLGFAKSADDNWALLNGLPELIAWDFRVLVGASRKRFLVALGGPERSPHQADSATAAVSALAAAAGAWAVRVHNVPASVDAVRVADAWTRGRALDDFTATQDYQRTP